MAVNLSSLSRQPDADDVREAVLRLQRGVQRDLQARVRSVTGPNPPAIERYQRNYMREFARYQAVSTYAELFAEVLASDLVFVGDYHTLRQSQEVAVRLIERAAADPRPLVVGLEMIHDEHQPHVDAYLRGDVDESQFRARVQYTQTWNFDWNNYRPLFDLARQRGACIVGINHAAPDGRGRLQARDARMAESVVRIVEAHPDARVMVLIGDLHLASDHLPRAVDELLAARALTRKRLVVHQNSDALYWHLAGSRAARDARVVRLGQGRYCVMEVPPFVKLQSYLSWEQSVEDADQDTFVEPIVLQTLVQRLADFLDLPRLPVQCDVFTNLDEAFFARLESSERVDPRMVREAHLLAFANRGCYVPATESVYLPYFSMNHATEQAMHVLCALHADAASVDLDAYEAFYQRTLRVALGFLASNLVNPRRRAISEPELRSFLRLAARRLREPQLAFRKQVARLVIQHKDYERTRLAGRSGRLKQIYDQDLDVTIEVTNALGCILGENMSDGLLGGGWSRDDLRQLVFDLPAAGAARYFELLAALSR